MKEKDKKLIEKIKEKFPRIFRKGEPRPRDPIKLNQIYESVKNSKKPIRLREISETTKLKLETVRRYVSKYLERKKYVSKDRAYTPPYLMIEPHSEDPDFVYGKENRDNRIEEELEKLESSTDPSKESKVDALKKMKNYNSQFFKLWNELVTELWKQKNYNANKIRIGSGANRYKI